MAQRLLLGLSMGTSKMAAMESTCIESEKEAQVLGCGWRIVTLSAPRQHLLLHHNGSVASMKRQAFRDLISANRRLRRKPPELRLVVSNPGPRWLRQSRLHDGSSESWEH